jgi:hypothetical protein
MMIMMKGVLLTIAQAAILPSESTNDENDRPHRYSVSFKRRCLFAHIFRDCAHFTR